VAVVVAPVTARDVPVRVRAIGNVQASATVSVLSQIGGEITKIHFKEGQDVATGDLLFTIDPRTFEAALQQARAQLAQHQAQITQAEANLARDKAQHDNAVVEEDRYRRLVDGGMIAREQYDQIRTNELSLAATIKAGQAAVETARAVVRADEAAVENMRLQLAYTQIRAPFDGRTGNLLIHQGNVVKANDVGNPLVVINRIHPIYVTFAVPEQELERIKRYRAIGALRVEAVPSGAVPRPGARRPVLRQQCGGHRHRDDPAQGELRQCRQCALAGPIRRRRPHPHHRDRRPRRPVAGHPERATGDLRLRRQARPHGRVPSGDTGAGRRP
jgi:multidrug efflux system membrane fusion protein